MHSSIGPAPALIQEPSARRTFLVLAAAACAAHAPALRNGFVLDDGILLSENPYVRTLSGLAVLLRHELFVASGQPQMVPYYRPLSGLLNWVSFQLVGASALLQHALNMVLHACVAMLLFAALRTALVRPSLALGTTLLFAVHPATAEVVAYLGGRQDMLGWLVAIGSWILLRRSRSIGVAAAVGFGASLMGAFCHEFFIVLFVPLGLIAGFDRERAARARGATVFFGGVAAVAGLLALRFWLELLDFEAHAGGPGRLLRAAIGVLLRLLKVVALPTDLAVNVTITLPSLAVAGACAAAGAVAAGWLVVAVRRWRRDMLGTTLAGVVIVALSAGVHAGVVLKYGFVSDRYAYALLVGLVVTVASALEAYSSAAPASAFAPASDTSPLVSFARKWGATALAFAIVPLTWSRVASWHDERSLQMAMIADRPSDPESQLAAGLMLFAQADIERAYPHCRAFSEARPDSDKANLCVGSWLLLHQRSAEAAAHLRPYALSRPGMEAARRAFLVALLASHQYDEASRTLADWSRMFAGASDLAEAHSTLESLQHGRVLAPVIPQTSPAPQ